MFEPVSITGKLFKKYLLSRKHVSKIRIQNGLGNHLFRKGINVKNVSGTVFNLMPNDWISRMILINGGYENGSVTLAKELLRNGGTFIDIGANFGLYTCSVAENNKVKIYAIEPNYIILPALTKNVELNKLNNVTILNTALSNELQFTSLLLAKSHNIGSASFTANNKSLISILSCTLNYVFEIKGIQTAELIKIDIEGNEFTVLKNFDFEKFYVKNILLEFNECAQLSFEDLKTFFTSKGFLMKDITGKPVIYKNNITENNLWLVNTVAHST